MRPARARVCLTAGETAPLRVFRTIRDSVVDIRSAGKPVHLQFRRFAGCPVCSIHLREFARRHEELARVVYPIVLFHSSRDDLLTYAADLPFDLVADPTRSIYRAYGVESSPRALLDPRAWPSIGRAIARTLPDVLTGRRPSPPLSPPGGRFGLPADFLLDADGRIAACYYGTHADDQWTVEQVVTLAGELSRERGERNEHANTL